MLPHHLVSYLGAEMFGPINNSLRYGEKERKLSSRGGGPQEERFLNLVLEPYAMKVARTVLTGGKRVRTPWISETRVTLI